MKLRRRHLPVARLFRWQHCQSAPPPGLASLQQEYRTHWTTFAREITDWPEEFKSKISPRHGGERKGSGAIAWKHCFLTDRTNRLCFESQIARWSSQPTRFIKLAGETSSSELDAVFCVQTAALMSKIHKENIALARITAIGGFPICTAKNGTVVIALQWDYAAWTPLAARFAQKIQTQNKPDSSYLVAISGVISPRLHQELEARHFQVQDRLSPGPLK
jgi:hypothetical protein